MNVDFRFPPMFDQISEAFDVKGKPVIFCWGGTIFNPKRVNITKELLAHEQVHSDQQGLFPENWWKRYIKDPVFRLMMELPAHRVELRTSNRHDRRKNFKSIVDRLCSPLYKLPITRIEAERLLRAD